MDPFVVVLTAALSTGLLEVGKELIKPLLEPAQAELREAIEQGTKTTNTTRRFQEAVQRALSAAGAPKGENELTNWAIKTGLARLQAPHASLLSRQVAEALIGMSDPQAAAPEALVLALHWPRQAQAELSTLLHALRRELAGVAPWSSLIRYADEQYKTGLLQQTLDEMRRLADTITGCAAGSRLRVIAEQQLRLSAAQYRQIEAEYRRVVADRYRTHIVSGLAQVKQAVSLPLKDIYLELGLIRLRGRAAEAGELLEMDVKQRLEMEMRKPEIRLSELLAEAPRLVIVGKPGSGKSTSLRYIAYLLAGGAAGAAALSLAAPFLPVLAPLAAYALELSKDNRLALEAFLLNNFMEAEYAGVPGGRDFLRAALQNGACAVLLDGLDEVGDFGDQLIQGQTLREVVLRRVQEFSEQRCQAQGNRLVVTSRLEGYAPGELAGFAEAELGLLKLPDEVEDFLLRFFTAYIQKHDPALSFASAQAQARQTRAAPLLESINRSESIQLLAINPLLLTILAVIYETTSAPLPNRRVELYQVVSKTLVEKWRRAQTLHDKRIWKALNPDAIYYLLAQLAYWLHEQRPGGLLSNAEWQAKLGELLGKYGTADKVANLTEEFMHHAVQEVGLLAERSPGRIGFFHLTLEEYLAAVQIARQDTDQRLKMTGKHWQSPRWQEVLLLTAGELQLRGNEDALEAYLSYLVNRQDGSTAEGDCRAGFLAARALADIGAESVAPNLRETIIQAAVRAAQARFAGFAPVLLRAAAADTADELGYLPDDLYDFVPAPERSAAQFWIGRYPVTNAQYARFLRPENFTAENRDLWLNFPEYAAPDQQGKSELIGDWGEAGWDWLQRALRDSDYSSDGKIVFPRAWHDRRFGGSRPGAPVVRITWYEANAYCRWLHKNWERLEESRQGTPRPEAIRLPLESEWVQAAGGAENGRYPWSLSGAPLDTPDEINQRSNTNKSGIGRTTPVWMYPAGQSNPYGVMDLGGNTWEWQANYYANDQDWLALRGGSWGSIPWDARVESRRRNRPGSSSSYYGVRVVLLPNPLL